MSLAARRSIAHLCLLAAAVLAWTLWRFPPETSGFYPQCPIFFWLHIYCPGCGATRALAALLHGRMSEAMHFNALVLAFLPVAVTFFGMSYLRAVRAETFHWPAIPNRALTLYLTAAAVFTVLRNL